MRVATRLPAAPAQAMKSGGAGRHAPGRGAAPAEVLPSEWVDAHTPQASVYDEAFGRAKSGALIEFKLLDTNMTGARELRRRDHRPRP